MSKERVTYVTYNEGLKAKHLHLGNLVHDYKNPDSLDPYVERAYTDTEEPPPAWARLIPLDNYALTLGKSSTKDVDDGEQSDDSADESTQRYRVAAAAKTIKIEIKDPEKFFNDTTLTSNEAKQWLSSRLSAAESIPPPKGKPRPQLQIWMLTGLILMTHATWTSLSSKDHSFKAGLQAPFDPTGVSAIRRLSVSDGVRPTFGLTENNEVKHISGAVIHETGKYPGTRGWAAQWRRVDVQILPGDKWKDGVRNQLRLKRTTESPPKIAVVELREDAYAENQDEEDEDGAEEVDDEYWEALLDAAEE